MTPMAHSTAFVTALERHVDFFSAMESIVTIAAVSVGMIVAILGLRTWLRELRGKDKYDISKKIRRSAYVIKFLLEDRMYIASQVRLEDLKTPSRQIEHFDQIYGAHADTIRHASEELKTAILDGCALVGTDLLAVVRPLQGNLVTFLIATTDYRHGLLSTSDEAKRRYEESTQLLFTASSETYKSFDRSVNDAVQFLQSSLKAMMGL